MDCHKILKNVEAEYLTKNPIPAFRAGDVIRVHAKVVEGESERIQPFEGVVLYRKGSGVSANYTVRKVSFGVGIERTFPLHSPRVVKIELIKSGKSRRARLYYLRKLSGKAARLAEKEPGTESKSPKKDKPEPALSPT